MEVVKLKQWTITKPFDTLLLKFWSDENINQLRDSLLDFSNGDVVEAMIPNKNKLDYYENNILHKTFNEFYTSKNLCDNYQFCQDVVIHSSGLACVTAAALKRRLTNNFSDKLGTLLNVDFQNSVMQRTKYVTKRQNIGVLIFDCPNDKSDLRNHIMEVLFENFYLYTTPTIVNSRESGYNNQVVNFIIKQISRNTDCMVIFVDHNMIGRWYNPNDNIEKILKNSFCWDFKVRLIILSLYPEADITASEIFKKFISFKPILVMYHQLDMAPSGGVIALVEKACQLNLKRSFLKYWLRGWEIFSMFHNDIKEDKSSETLTHTSLITLRTI